MTKERDYSIDFLRALCALGIILFHFYSHTSEDLPKLFVNYANGTTGNTLVNVFFIISGYSLYMNNKEIPDLLVFYKKRFLSIFPMFYLCFTIRYLSWIARGGIPFYGGHPVKILLTVFGVDGYFSYLTPTYYQVGEWFLGAIVMLYAVYPLILKVFNRSAVLCLVISAALYSTVFIKGLYKITIGMNMFCCLISFVFGMVLCKYKQNWQNKLWIAAAAFAAGLIPVLVRLPSIPNNLCIHIVALCTFISFHYLGTYVMKGRIANTVFSGLSRLSFATFLTHHVFLQWALRLYMPHDTPHALLYWLLLTVIILAMSESIYMLNQVVLSKLRPLIMKTKTTE